MIKELQSDEISQGVGWYAVFYLRQEKVKYVGKLISVDVDNQKMKYEIISGSNKGETGIGKFSTGRPLKVYDEGSLVKALLEV